MTKKQFKAVRLVLGLSQKEYAEILQVSHAHVQKTEGNWTSSYNVSKKLANKVNALIDDMGLNQPDVLELARRKGYLDNE